MEIRHFLADEKDTKELIEMYVDLSNYDNEEPKSYGQHVNVLFELLNKKGSECFIIEKNGNIAGYAIVFSDGKGGSVGQNFYLKEEYRKTFTFSRAMDWLEDYLSKKYEYCLLVGGNDYACSLYEKKYDKLYTVYKFKRKKDGNRF